LQPGAADASEAFTVGIRFRVEKDWYLYWINPGDAGLPIEAVWDLPEGLGVDRVDHPTPHKKLADEAMSFVHDGEFMLLARFTPQAGLAPGPVRIGLKLDWLACKEVCIQGGDSLAVTLGDQDPCTIARNREIIEKAESLIPATLPADIPVTAILSRSPGDSATVRITVENGLPDDCFPVSIEEFLLDHSAISIQNGAITLPLLAAGPEARLERLRGLLFVGGRAYSFDTRVRQQNPD